MDVLSTRQIEGLFYNLGESRPCLDGAEKELTVCEENVRNIAYEIRALSDVVSEIQREVEGIIKHRKDEVENVWDLVYDLSGGGRRLSIESNGTQHSFTSAASAAAARRLPFLMGVVEEEEDELLDEDEVMAKGDQHEQKRVETNAVATAKAAEATAAVGARFVGDGNAKFLLDLGRLLKAHGAVLSRIVALKQAVADANRQRLLGVSQPLDDERLRLLGDNSSNGVATEAKAVYDYLRSFCDSDARDDWKSIGLARGAFRKEYHLLYPVTSLDPLDTTGFPGQNDGCKIENRMENGGQNGPKFMKPHKRSLSDSTATYTFISTENEKTVTSYRDWTGQSFSNSPIYPGCVELFNCPTTATMTRKRCMSLEDHGSARISLASRLRRFSYEKEQFPLVGSGTLIAPSSGTTDVVVASQNDEEGDRR